MVVDTGGQTGFTIFNKGVSVMAKIGIVAIPGRFRIVHVASSPSMTDTYIPIKID
jgi:hypothetical protein